LLQDGEDESVNGSDFNEEAIVVTRQEEAVDPEDEADFEREYAKMMAESLESRKFDRKPLFDVPLPVRPKNRDSSAVVVGQDQEPVPANNNKMAFSLLTKKGNRQQVRGPQSTLPPCRNARHILTFADSHC
jgi:regulator of nonsense transcripts 2